MKLIIIFIFSAVTAKFCSPIGIFFGAMLSEVYNHCMECRKVPAFEYIKERVMVLLVVIFGYLTGKFLFQ